MTPRSREYYDVEGYWKGGETVDLTGVLLPSAPGGEYVAEDDAFFRLDASGDLEAETLAQEALSKFGETTDSDPFWDLDDDIQSAAPSTPQVDENDPFWA